VVLISRGSRRFCPGTTVCCGVIDVGGVSLLDGVTDVGVALLDGVTDVGVALLDGVTDEVGVALLTIELIGVELEEAPPQAVRAKINKDVSVVFFIVFYL
jgi:hypothetical protein